MLSKNGYCSYSLGLLLLLGLFTNPVFAEVTNLQTNNKSFYKGDQIEFLGTVENGSTGLVTIVIRNLNDEFVLLTQASIDQNNSFEKKIEIDEQFTKHGNYSAVGFILNMTQGAITNFGISLNEVPVKEDNEIDKQTNQEIIIDNPVIVKESQKLVEPMFNIVIVDFVDTSKDPSYYVERYYSEPAYKSWFDMNYPGQTIEESVGYDDNIDDIEPVIQEPTDNKIIPEAQASPIVQAFSAGQQDQNITDSSDIAQIILSVAALGILFGAVYGVKRQVDNNTKQISLNKHTIRKKILNPILGLDPKDIIQTRLAKGEITLEEYEKLKTKLN